MLALAAPHAAHAKIIRDDIHVRSFERNRRSVHKLLVIASRDVLSTDTATDLQSGGAKIGSSFGDTVCGAYGDLFMEALCDPTTFPPLG